jgi:hypothetical protein
MLALSAEAGRLPASVPKPGTQSVQQPSFDFGRSGKKKKLDNCKNDSFQRFMDKR